MKEQNVINLSRADKILIAMYELSTGAKKNLKYEDIVVGAFKKFPQEFHLRGYEEYPDSGDLIHKPLYDFRKKGLLEANNKVFSLTDRGLAYAKQLHELGKKMPAQSTGRLSRFAEKEIARIESTEGLALFMHGKQESVSDTDFYNYLGVTPRTSRNDFMGRLRTVEETIAELGHQTNLSDTREKIIAYHNFLVSEKFKNIVEHFKPS